MLLCLESAKSFGCLRVQFLDEKDLGQDRDAPRDGLKVGFGLKSSPTLSYIEPREFSMTKIFPKS